MGIAALLALVPVVGLADATHRGTGTLAMGKQRTTVRSAVAFCGGGNHFVRILLLTRELGPKDFGENGTPLLSVAGPKDVWADLSFWFDRDRDPELRTLKMARLELYGLGEPGTTATLHWNKPTGAQGTFSRLLVTDGRVRLTFQPTKPEARAGSPEDPVTGSVQVDTPLYPMN